MGSLQRIVGGVSQQRDTPRRDSRRPASTLLAERQRNQHDGSAARTSEARKRQHYARPGHVSFDERSFKLATLAVESFGRLGEEGYEFIVLSRGYIARPMQSHHLTGCLPKLIPLWLGIAGRDGDDVFSCDVWNKDRGNLSNLPNDASQCRRTRRPKCRKWCPHRDYRRLILRCGLYCGKNLPNPQEVCVYCAVDEVAPCCWR